MTSAATALNASRASCLRAGLYERIDRRQRGHQLFIDDRRPERARERFARQRDPFEHQHAGVLDRDGGTARRRLRGERERGVQLARERGGPRAPDSSAATAVATRSTPSDACVEERAFSASVTVTSTLMRRTPS